MCLRAQCTCIFSTILIYTSGPVIRTPGFVMHDACVCVSKAGLHFFFRRSIATLPTNYMVCGSGNESECLVSGMCFSCGDNGWTQTVKKQIRPARARPDWYLNFPHLPLHSIQLSSSSMMRTQTVLCGYGFGDSFFSDLPIRLLIIFTLSISSS